MPQKPSAVTVTRPRHLTILDEIGMKKSMPADPARFEWSAALDRSEGPLIFLGLGPEPDKLPEWLDLPPDKTVFYLECQAFVDQVDGWRPPANFERITPEEFATTATADTRVARYLPAQRAFPAFFAPLTARLALGDGPPVRKTKTAWLPCTEDDLLGRELTLAFEAKGYAVRFLDHEAVGKHPGKVLPELLKEGAPDLFFSINFKGLDHFGLGYAILREAGVPVAVWMVDNPFNLLPAVKAHYWKDAHLFVTDHTFIGPLVEAGARRVSHLPLAASPEVFAKGGKLPEHGRGLEDRLVFVGRSEFPDRDRFFAGETIPAELVYEVIEETASRRDYSWWRDRLEDVPMWPGNAVRAIGAGAEFSGHHWKRVCLTAAGPVTIFGDRGWKDLENADLRPFVDYYAHLPAIYRKAACVLNVTGGQLPAGLTQRHFDVWCAGGFLLTDTHPGLNIFPEELAAPVRFSHPDEILPLFERYRADSPQKRELAQAWQELILRDHTYADRVETVLTALSL
jgi:spore maturation protein CgeB